AAELGSFDNRIEGTVTSLLFNGAASRILVRDAAANEEIEVNLPQSGEYASLARGDKVQIGWSGAQGNCFPLGAA
ncbi:MAG: TOBE domain-containing protein, partial [Maritimibacter sp.]|nr:TOBE domain-containing protein [Maritimibacter sp.]